MHENLVLSALCSAISQLHLQGDRGGRVAFKVVSSSDPTGQKGSYSKCHPVCKRLSGRIDHQIIGGRMAEQRTIESSVSNKTFEQKIN